MFFINSCTIFFTSIGGIPSPITFLTILSSAQSGIFQSGGREVTISNSYIVKHLGSEYMGVPSFSCPIYFPG